VDVPPSKETSPIRSTLNAGLYVVLQEIVITANGVRGKSYCIDSALQKALTFWSSKAVKLT